MVGKFRSILATAVLARNTNVIGGVTSFGINGNCAGTGGVYRVDRADDLDWLYATFGGQL